MVTALYQISFKAFQVLAQTESDFKINYYAGRLLFNYLLAGKHKF